MIGHIIDLPLAKYAKSLFYEIVIEIKKIRIAFPI